MNEQPQRHWDGSRWLNWNGTEWVPEAGLPASQPVTHEKRRRVWVLPLIVGVVSLLVGAGIGAAGASGNSADVANAVAASAAPTVTVTVTASAAAAAPSSAPSSEAPPVSSEPASPKYDRPSRKDLTITIKVKSKHCFGSAGCNVTFGIGLSIGDLRLDPDKTYAVTYTVHGDEDGPIIDTLEMTGDTFTSDEGIASTPSSHTKLTATVTSVSQQGT